MLDLASLAFVSIALVLGASIIAEGFHNDDW